MRAVDDYAKGKKRGPTGNRTPTKGFKVLCADRYTIEPWLTVLPIKQLLYQKRLMQHIPYRACS